MASAKKEASVAKYNQLKKAEAKARERRDFYADGDDTDRRNTERAYNQAVTDRKAAYSAARSH